MKLSEKVRHLREIEGNLRDLGRAMTQGELVRALRDELNGSLSQSYLSQIESGTRPHLTNTTRMLLARFFRVHPGYLVDDPEGYIAELPPDPQHVEDKLDLWLVGGAERFRKDPELCRALLVLARHEDSRRCILLLQSMLESAASGERSLDPLRRGYGAQLAAKPRPSSPPRAVVVTDFTSTGSSQ